MYLQIYTLYIYYIPIPMGNYMYIAVDNITIFQQNTNNYMGTALRGAWWF